MSQAQLLSSVDSWSDRPDILARFYNTLSYLEHVGSRKILTSAIDFTEEHLRHAFEETRHALRFKKIARTLGGNTIDDYRHRSMLGGVSPFYYFQKLDVLVRSYCAEHGHQHTPLVSYLLVTYIVEVRAASLYPALQQVMNDKGLEVNLRAIIAEEDHHLEEVQEALQTLGNISPSDIERLIEQEGVLFERLIEAVCKEGDALNEEYRKILVTNTN